MNQRDPDAANDSRHNVVIGNTFDGRHLRHAILLQFRTHNNLVAENTIVGSHLDAIDLHGEGEYLNEIRDNTVIGGNKHKQDASGPGNWVHSNNLIGNRQGILVILGTPDTLIEDNRITAGEKSKAGIEIPMHRARSCTVTTSLEGLTGSGPSDSVRNAALTEGAKGSPQASRSSTTSFDRPPTASGLMQERNSAWWKTSSTASTELG